jgi:hypothetical protein
VHAGGVEITVLHVEGCPHLELARQRVAEALTETGTAAEVNLEVVATAQQAAERGFNGSPTILVDGTDPFPAPDEPVGLACRLFHTDEGMQGAPTVSQLAAVLTR